jgi:hypothetical protein
VQIVRHLREQNAVFGIVTEELTVGVDVLECEMGPRPLEVLTSQERVADACVQRNCGRKSERCIDPDDGTGSHFFGACPLLGRLVGNPPFAA